MTYATIVADPPWPFRWSGGVGGAHRNPTPMGLALLDAAIRPDEAFLSDDFFGRLLEVRAAHELAEAVESESLDRPR